MKTLRVNTIYPSFMGEVNIHGIGAPCTFVRLAGCNLRCYSKTKGILCDTPEALEAKNGNWMYVSDIVEEVKRYNRKVVCLTGGEPLMQDVRPLLMELSNAGYYVVVETNGSRRIALYRHFRNVSFVVDVKSTSSGESEQMLEENYGLLDKDDFLKFVIDTQEDYTEFFNWVKAHPNPNCRISVGTFWGSEMSYDKLINNINYDMWNIPIYLNMQTHKMACLYDKHKLDEDFFDLFIPKDI